MTTVHRFTTTGGTITFDRGYPGRYILLLDMVEGAGAGALAFLRETFAEMFTKTDCLVTIARILPDNTYSRQLGRQIIPEWHENEGELFTTFVWTYGAYCRAHGIEPDLAAKAALRNDAIPPGNDGGRASVVDLKTMRVVNMIVANAARDKIAGHLLVDTPDDVPFDWPRYVWNGAALVPDDELQAELDAAWDAAVREAS